MATFRSAATNTGNSVSTLAINVPAGTTQGDIMLASLVYGQGTSITITPPAGWSLILRTDDTTTMGLATYWKSANASEPANYSWAPTATNISGAIVTYTASPKTSPFTTGSNQDATADTNLTAPSVTPTRAGAMLVCCFGGRQTTLAATTTPPGGMTERADACNSLTGFHSIEIAELQLTDTSATGTKVATLSQTKADQISHSIIIEPNVYSGSNESGTLGLYVRVGDGMSRSEVAN